MSTYKLYACYNEKSPEIPKGVEFSFRSCDTKYLIVFTNKELGEPFAELPADIQLTREEARIVLGWKNTVNGRVIEEHKDEYLGFLNDLNDSLEKAIKEAKKKAKPKRQTEGDGQ